MPDTDRSVQKFRAMCRAIKTLHNFAPPATSEEIRASSLQFVRKLSGFTHPSKANEAAFNRAVEDVSHAAHHLLESLVSNAPPRDRTVEAQKARARARNGVAQARPTDGGSRFGELTLPQIEQAGEGLLP